MPITGLADLKGKKVRVYDQSLAKFIEKLGGIPVTISFGETQQALERGVTDCAITGPSSANSAGWPEVTTHFMPIGFQIALNAYAINLTKWNALPADQQAKIDRGVPASSRARSGPTRGAVRRRGALQRRQGALQDGQEVRDEGSAGDSRPTSS